MLKKEEEVMAKRKKKNAFTLILLLVVLAALCGVYFWYSGKKKENEQQEDTAAIDLLEIDTDSISSMHYVREDADIILIKQGDEWVSKNEPDRPINQDNVKAMLNAIKSIKAEKIVAENPDNLDDYGLMKPEALIEVTLNDGSVVSLKIGIEIIHSMGYYGMINDDKNVYQLPRATGLPFRYNNTDMTKVEETPDVDSSKITYINISNKNGNDIELKYQGDKFYNISGNTLSNWKILKPYGEAYVADAAAIQGIQTNYSYFSFLSCVDYKCEELGKYGLDDPLATIHVEYTVTRTEKLEKPELDEETQKLVSEKSYEEPAEYTLYIGKQNDDGNYYVRLEGSKAVHTMNQSTVDNMLNVNAFSLLDKYVLLPNIQDVDYIEAEANGKVYKMEIKRRSETDDNGKEKTVASYYFNGEEVEEKPFKTLYQVMITSQYDAEIKDKVDLNGAKPVLSLSFHLFGDGEGTYSAKFYPYNDSFNVIERPDGFMAFADKRRIDAIIESITTFTGKTAEQ